MEWNGMDRDRGSRNDRESDGRRDNIEKNEQRQ